jgi:WD40 repeat protein/tRNA A-37 threonylcarbamoyl transferase component Bud32
MDAPAKCPNCQIELPKDLLMGLCPNCLGRVVFQLGLLSPANASAEPDARILGDYELLEVIGRGGMGVVWRARQLRLNRFVALKVVLAGHLATDAEIKRFQREAQNAARLDHPNIVGIYEVGEHQGQHFFAMQLIEGASLGQWLRRRQEQLSLDQVPEPCAPLDSPEAAARLVATVARAMHHAHQRGILHRDLKPGNILLDSHGEPHLADFGLARQADLAGDLTQSETVLGTPHYISPEQAQGKKDLTTATDIYSLGAILYHLLAGRPPFQAATTWQTLRATVEQPPLRPSGKDRRIDSDLEIICLKCLEKDPQCRYASADALAEELERWLRHEPIRARPARALERCQKWTRRHPRKALGIALLGGSLAVGIMGMMWGYREAVSSRRQALQAEAKAIEKLWDSYLAQARANRWSHRPGQRILSLSALSNAAAIHPSLELRNEAIAALALPDVQIERQWRLDPPVPLFNGLVFDPPVERYARAHEQGEVTICRAVDDAELCRLPGLGPRLEAALCFSPDGRYLADSYKGAHTNSFRVWDLQRRIIVLAQPWLPQGMAFAFSPDSTQIAMAQDKLIYFYGLASGREMLTYPVPYPPHHLRFDPSGKSLALCSAESAELTVLETVSGKKLRAFATTATSCAWNGDGTLLASGSPDHEVFIWDVRTGQRRAELRGHTAFVTDVAFDSTGDWLASHGWDDVTRFWDLILGEPLLTMPGGLIKFNAPSPNNRRLGYHLNVYHAGFWRLSPALECRRWKADGECFNAAFDPTGRLLVTADFGGVHIWDVEARQLLEHWPAGPSQVALYIPDTKELVTGGRNGLERRRFEAASGRLKLGTPQCLTTSRTIGASWCPQTGQVAAMLDDNQDILVLDLAGNRPAQRLPGMPLGSGLSWSHDGKLLAIGNWNGQDVSLCVAASGQLVKLLPAGKTAQPLFSPDGQFLVIGEVDQYRVLLTGTWNCAYQMPRDRVGGGSGRAVFSPDGTMLALQQGQLGQIKILAPGSWKELCTFEEGIPLCFTPDGSKLAAYSAEGKMLIVWDLRRLRAQLSAIGLDWDTPHLSPAFSGDSAPPSPIAVRREPLPADHR